MKDDLTIAFIGAGNMAQALIQGLIATERLAAQRIVASDPDKGRLGNLRSELSVRVTSNNREAVADADVVVLATKPQVLSLVLEELAPVLPPDALVISIAAGVPTRKIQGALTEGVRVVRTMPNTPALVGAGATAIAAGLHATEEDMVLTQRLFESVGIVVRVLESHLDAVTGLSGSGPAYVFSMIEALRDAGVREGLSEPIALRLAAQTVQGAARLLLESGEPPETLRERVTSPGGTTLAGLQALQEQGFHDAVAGAVRAATRRSSELGKITEG